MLKKKIQEKNESGETNDQNTNSHNHTNAQTDHASTTQPVLRGASQQSWLECNQPILMLAKKYYPNLNATNSLPSRVYVELQVNLRIIKNFTLITQLKYINIQ